MTVLSRILVATDYSPCGSAAVARAGQLAQAHGAELRLLHVSPDWNLFSRSLPAHQAHYASVTRYAEASLQRDIERLHQQYSIRARGDVHLGNASQRILRLVAEYQPHLLVIGARGEHAGAVAPAALGGTALKLVAETRQPILIVRNADPAPYQEFEVALSDAGEHGRRILQWGLTVAPQGVCHLVRAYEVPYFERLRQCGIEAAAILACTEQAQAAAQRMLDGAASAVAHAKRIHTHVMPGEPLQVVLTRIVCDRVQLLVLGKHAESITESDHALIGSVGLRLAYHSPVDVLVVP